VLIPVDLHSKIELWVSNIRFHWWMGNLWNSAW